MVWGRTRNNLFVSNTKFLKVFYKNVTLKLRYYEKATKFEKKIFLLFEVHGEKWGEVYWNFVAFLHYLNLKFNVKIAISYFSLSMFRSMCNHFFNSFFSQGHAQLQFYQRNTLQVDKWLPFRHCTDAFNIFGHVWGGSILPRTPCNWPA